MLSYCYPDGVAFQPDYLNNQAGLRPDCRIGGDWTGGYNGLAVITDNGLSSINTNKKQNTHKIQILYIYYLQILYKHPTNIIHILYAHHTHTSMGLGCFGLHRKKLCLITDIGKDIVITYWHMQHHRRVVLCVCRACVAYSALHYQHIASFYHILCAPDPNCSIRHHVQY